MTITVSQSINKSVTQSIEHLSGIRNKLLRGLCSIVGNMAVVFTQRALFHAILPHGFQVFLFILSLIHIAYDAYILNVSRADGITNVVPEFSVSFECCAVSHHVNSSLIGLPLWSRPPATVLLKLLSHVRLCSRDCYRIWSVLK